MLFSTLSVSKVGPLRLWCGAKTPKKFWHSRQGGIELVESNLSDNAPFEGAIHGAYGVFGVQPSSGQGAAYNVSDADEIRYGKAIADIA